MLSVWRSFDWNHRLVFGRVFIETGHLLNDCLSNRLLLLKPAIVIKTKYLLIKTLPNAKRFEEFWLKPPAGVWKGPGIC